MSATRIDFPRKHQNIFRYSCSRSWTFNADDVRVPYAEATKARARYSGASLANNDKLEAGYALNAKGKIPDTVWTIRQCTNVEHTKYDNQKPERLYHREDVLTIDDTRKGNSLSEFQQFIPDCYLPRDGRKGRCNASWLPDGRRQGDSGVCWAKPKRD